MNTRGTKRHVSSHEEPPPPPKRQATGKPDPAPTPLPKPGGMKAIRGGKKPAGGRKKLQKGKEAGENWKSSGTGTSVLAGMAGMGAQPSPSQPPTYQTPLGDPPQPASGGTQGPFLRAFHPTERFKGLNPILAAANRFRGMRPTRYAPQGTRLESVKGFAAWEGSGVFEGVKDEDRAGMKWIDESVMTYAMQRQWLDSEQNWRMRLGGEWREEQGKRWFVPEWEGKKLLGMGGNGIVGLWERIQAPEEMEQDYERVIPQHVDRVAVKQQKPGDPQIFAEECQWMRRLGGRGKHLIEMYGYSLMEKGQGTYGGPRGLDPLDKPVQRVFLDYCDGGNFEDFSYEYYKKYSAEKPCPEKLVWKVFQCLAQACCVFENGNEASSGDAEFGDTKVVHFDLKIENVFVKNEDPDHLETPLLVIGDFGHMEWVKKPPMDKDWYKVMKKVGTENAYPPEQYEDDLEATFGIPEYLGTGVNIWAIGKIMHHFITRGRECNPEAYTYSNGDGTWTEQQPYQYLFAQLNEQNPHSWLLTQGPLLLNAPYSHTLRTLVLQCLALDWRHRPSARRILGIVEGALGIVRSVEEVLDVEMMDAELEEFAEANQMDLDD